MPGSSAIAYKLRILLITGLTSPAEGIFLYQSVDGFVIIYSMAVTTQIYGSCGTPFIYVAFLSGAEVMLSQELFPS